MFNKNLIKLSVALSCLVATISANDDLSLIMPKESSSSKSSSQPNASKQKPTNSMTKIEYSFLMPTQQKFITFLSEAEITADEAKQIYNDCAASPKNAFICAMAYDQGYSRANDTVESYYRIAADANVEIAGRIARYEFADYKFRTGFGDGVRDYFKNGECYTKKQPGVCFYILGMSDFLTNKNCKFLNMAKKEGVKSGLVNRLCN